jgi:hypothetical protein
MRKECDICKADLRGQDDAVYSTTTKAYFCRVQDWNACAERAEQNYLASEEKRAA